MIQAKENSLALFSKGIWPIRNYALGNCNMERELGCQNVFYMVPKSLTLDTVFIGENKLIY